MPCFPHARGISCCCYRIIVFCHCNFDFCAGSRHWRAHLRTRCLSLWDPQQLGYDLRFHSTDAEDITKSTRNFCVFFTFFGDGYGIALPTSYLRKSTWFWRSYQFFACVCSRSVGYRFPETDDTFYFTNKTSAHFFCSHCLNSLSSSFTSFV